MRQRVAIMELFLAQAPVVVVQDGQDPIVERLQIAQTITIGTVAAVCLVLQIVRVPAWRDTEQLIAVHVIRDG